MALEEKYGRARAEIAEIREVPVELPDTAEPTIALDKYDGAVFLN
jgi:hypothetical protein